MRALLLAWAAEQVNNMPAPLPPTSRSFTDVAAATAEPGDATAGPVGASDAADAAAAADAADGAPAAGPAEAAADAQGVSAWPVAWGTAGEPAAASPFQIVIPDELPNTWAGAAQRGAQLCSPPPTDFLKTAFAAIGYDHLSGFSNFERYHEFMLWRVPVPEFDQSEDQVGSSSRVPVGKLHRDFITVGQILMLRCILAFVVCSPPADVNQRFQYCVCSCNPAGEVHAGTLLQRDWHQGST